MLTRIYIDNFRCFVNFEYKPKSKQLLLGSNGSGKSSLLTAIRYLKQFVKGGANEFTQSTRTRWQDRPLQVLEIDALLNDQEYEYRVEIRFEPETKELSVSQERLKVSGTLVFERVGDRVNSPLNGAQANSAKLDNTLSALPRFQSSNLQVGRFIEWMGSLHCFRIDEYPNAMHDQADREEREPDHELENLAGWYRFEKHEHSDENERFLSSMKEVLPGFQTLRFSPDEDGVQRLRCDFVGPLRERTSYTISELSEGQRCLLALYMILHFLIARGHTVFIDEPDNFIALREIQPWLLAAEAAVDDYDGQLLLISHHPELLDQWASTYGVRLFREDNGHVRTEKFKPDPAGNLHPSEMIARGWENE